MIDDFHLESLNIEELSSLRQALDLEEKRRARQSRIDDLDIQIAELRRALESASPRHDNQPHALLYSGGQLRQSQACHCRWCIQGEIGVLENRRQYMLEAK